MKIKNKSIISILLFQIALGISPILLKNLSPQISSSVYVLVRFGLASLLLIGMYPFFKKNYNLSKLTKKEISLMILLGILGTGIASNLNLPTIQMLGSVLGSLVISLEFPIAIFLGVLIFKEKVTPKFMISAAIIFLGLVLVVLFKNSNSQIDANNFFPGLIIGLITALTFAVCTIIGKFISKSVTPLTLTTFRLIAGTVITLLGLIIQNQLGDALITIQSLQFKDILILLWLGLFTSGFGFVLYYIAMKEMEVKKISLFLTISPVLSVVIGLFFGESFHIVQFLGIVLMLIGLIVINKK